MGRVGEVEVESHTTASFLSALAEVPTDERKVALQVLCASTALDGKLCRRDRRLVVAAYHAAGFEEVPLSAVNELARGLSGGEGIADELLDSLV